jgi:hypothetical protein
MHLDLKARVFRHDKVDRDGGSEKRSCHILGNDGGGGTVRILDLCFDKNLKFGRNMEHRQELIVP